MPVESRAGVPGELNPENAPDCNRICQCFSAGVTSPCILVTLQIYLRYLHFRIRTLTFGISVCMRGAVVMT